MSNDVRVAVSGDEPALVPYITAGDPSLAATTEYVEALAAGGADVIELGMPFSEPIADGPTIQNAIQRSLEAGTTPERYFELVESLDIDVPIVCMTYYNLLYQYGEGEPGDSDYERLLPFVERAAEAGVSGLIIPDLPVDESDPLRQACDEYGVDLIFIVAPTTTDERLAKMREQVSGFVYVQARLGTTGAQADVSDATHESLTRLAEWEVPKAVGFGVSEGQHATEIVEAGAAGVVAGSVFVDMIAAGEDVPNKLEAKARELKQGALDGAVSSTPEPGK
ncbi:tryptophan synthase subunit alpha [Natranaeroarchaeum aerophilus]|uniref:Tryptophan synthase alpha chain n=1 Tax=Natranaeroarchaeum aerophilus TaxID=2917711 RepID=A0AAE3K401_9EURY|nr:tryptophan synthase subunit alpha [Natranaeroarchaeum aerophilus]MCL9812863.1 tryptophan synthase subunit alpha [Natranaeroarchaeum aerophilus]